MSHALRNSGIIAALLAPAPAWAHVEEGPADPNALWTAWSVEPMVLAGLAVLIAGYAAGVSRLWSEAGAGRGASGWQAASFAAGALALVIALVSPLDQMGGSLFSAHMAQHILLTAVAPPLLLLGRPVVLLWSLPIELRSVVGRWIGTGLLPRIWRWMARPAIAVSIEAAVLWGWHLPGAVNLALTSELAHTAMHLSYLLGGLLMWEALAHAGQRRSTSYLVAAASAFLTMLHSGLLGALLTFAPEPLYAVYAGRTSAWGLTSLEDQQLAGLLMWVICGLIYVTAAILLFGAWLRRLEQHSGERPSIAVRRSEAS